MKTLAASLFALTFAAASSFAGSFGPGPWANGAYYPGQMDGIYSAVAIGQDGADVVSGTIGFALNSGSSLVSTNSSATSLTVDPNRNYFVMWINGRTYVGNTAASGSIEKKAISGSLFNGIAPSTGGFLRTTNTTVSTNGTSTNVVLTAVVISNQCGGAFVANLTSSKAVLNFNGSGIISTTENGDPTTTNEFDLQGTRVGSLTSTSQQ
jgi:hypothetical protein